jgi:hypothetical protein
MLWKKAINLYDTIFKIPDKIKLRLMDYLW